MLRTHGRATTVGRCVIATACLAAAGVVAVAPLATAQARPGALAVHTRVDRGGAATFLGGTPTRPLAAPRPGDPEAIAEAFGEQAAPLHEVDPASDLVAQDAVDMADGGSTVRLQQEFAGIPVLAGELAVRIADNGSVLSSAGEVVHDLGDVDVATAPRAIGGDAAAAAAVALTARNDAIDAAALSASTPELMIYDPALLGVTTDPHGARPVWQVDVRTEIGDVNRFVLIDANSGAVALTFSNVHAAADVQVCDAANSANSLPCAAPVRSTSNNVVSLVADVNAAYDNALATYEYYSTVLDRDSIDGAGLPIVSTVRYCPSSCPYSNAFWNGEQMVYGPGFAIADDVVGHELAHGVTQYESGLLYYAESGAINESLSDVFGELIDQWNVNAADAGDVRWELGEDLSIGAIRNMANPPAFGDPDKMTSTLYHGAETDEHGVHINSGVNNKAAFLMTDGGTFNGQTITALGATKTAKIYYEAQTALLTAGSDYRDLAAALQQACTNLIGSAVTNASDCQNVTKVVLATEMTLDPTTPGSKLNAPVCPANLFKYELLVDDFEMNSGLFTTNAAPGTWVYSTDASQGDARSVHGENVGIIASTTLTMAAPVTVPAGTTYLRFDHSFSFDATINSSNQAGNAYWDGGVVEYSTTGSGGTWNSITLAASGANAINGYNTTLRISGSDNPMRGSAAFGGNSPAFQSTRYNVSALAGQNVQFRFRISTDSSVAYPGWYIDDFSIYQCGSEPTAPAAPNVPAGSASSGSVTLSWTAPNSNGAPITDYRIQKSTDGGTTWAAASDTVSAATTATVTGLTDATENLFRVAAVNSKGTGRYGSPSAVLRPAAAPSPATLAALPPTMRIADGTPALGQPVSISRGGFAPAEWVAIVLGGSSPRVIGTTRASGSGVIAGTFTVPNDVIPGANQIALLGLASGIGSRSPMTIGLGDDGFAFPTGSGFTALTPARVFDSRPGEPEGAVTITKQRYGGLTELRVRLAGAAGVPASGASAVSLNVTAVNPVGPGFLTVYPCGSRPLASSLNFVAGDVVPNAVIAPLSISGDVCFFSSVDTHVLADVNGWFAAGAGFQAVAPARVFDSRPDELQGLVSIVKQRYGGATELRVRVVEIAGVPATGVAAVSLNVTAIDPSATGFITVYPCGTRPLASSLNYVAGQIVPNAVIAPVSPSGEVCIFSTAGTHLLADINGWFASASGFVGLTPVRIFDSRTSDPQGAVPIIKQRYGGAAEIRVRVTGVAGLPNAGVGSVSLNVTAVNPSAAGFVTVYPCGTRPLASNLNYTVGQIVPNAVITPVSPTGEICLFSSQNTDLLADITGWFNG